ncbi:MAG: alpha-L-rhamnosidase N-terminal domain-containing protein [Bacteroidota bacterium]
MEKIKLKNNVSNINLFVVFSLLAGFITSCIISEESTNPETPTNLRIQDQTEQTGIDVRNPKFGWHVNDKDRGEIQTAYRILVASSKQKINADTGDLWDSEKVISSNQYGIKYNGSDLKSNTKYWWKVTTWDGENRQSPWSVTKTFITGFLDPSEWTANWIKSGSNITSIPYMLRKQFRINKTIDYATANICGLGQFELNLNGQKVGDHELDPGWTEYTKSQQYVVFDVTSMLQSGINVIGVWLADGWLDLDNFNGRYQGYSTHSDGEKCMIMELNILYEDGTSDKIISDTTWKTSTGPITYSNVFGGEDYDARKEKTGWGNEDYNDSSWTNAVVTTSPGGILNAQFQPPIKVVETLNPIDMIQNGKSIDISFGKTYSGIFDVRISGEKGQAITITMDDGSGTFNTYCRYTLKGGGIEVFRPKFFFWGQNKITVEGASLSGSSNLPQLHELKGYVLCSSAQPAGTFNSSDSLYNRIFAINKQGIMSNMYSIITDCPHREKAAWLNDMNFTSPSFAVLFDVQTLFRKINQDITETQQETGWIVSMSPNYRDLNLHDEVFFCSPFFDISSMRFPWIMYQQYGDIETLQRQYNVAKTSLAYLTSRSSGHLIGYGLGDWLDPDPVSTEFIETCVYYDFVTTMEHWAAILEKADDASNYSKLAANIKNAFNAKYFNKQTHNYGSQQTANTVPLHHGMVPKGEENSVFNALIKSIESSDYKINCGQNAHGYMLQVLSRYGRDDLVGRIHTNTKGPSFGGWVEQGKTNTPERWDGGGSQQHHMNNAFPEWICKNLAGISNIKPGFEEIMIRPTFATSYVPEKVSYSLETIRGIITSSWSRSENSYSLNVTIPVNCVAKVYIPTFGNSEVSIYEGKTVLWSNGSVLEDPTGISYFGLDGVYPSSNNYVIFNVGSGTYYFKSKWQ